MSGNGNNGRRASGPDVRMEHLDHTLRRLEGRAETWSSPLALTRLSAIRRRRHAIERIRLQMGWSVHGTDGSNL